MEKKPTKVLRILADFNKGGIQSEVMNPARLLPKEEVQFDAMLLSDKKGYYEKEFRRYGKIYRLPIKRKKTKLGRFLSLYTNYGYVKREMIKFFKDHPDYDAVHCHHLIYNAPCILAAKKAGIPVRIAHCAVDRPKGAFKDRTYLTLHLKHCAAILRKHATHCFGVTRSAVEYLCGEGHGIVMKNPTLDMVKFNPNLYQELKGDGQIHLLMVGSYGNRKNQKFALEILKELLRDYPDSTATFIGYAGTNSDYYLPDMKKYVSEHGMEGNVRFLPQDADIPLEMAKATLLLIPSLQEGLPNVALEAQAMGLSCFVSTDVSEECNCGLCHFYPLSDGPTGWKKHILDYVAEYGYDRHLIDMSAWDNKKISQEYLEYWRGKPMQIEHS